MIGLDLVFVLSKVFWVLARPGNLLLLFLLIATLVAWLRPAKGRGGARLWLTLLSAVLLFVAFAPVSDWLARPLEERFPVPAALPAQIDGILVLGGIAQQPISSHRETLSVNDSAERLMASAALALHHPGARLVITGRGEDQPSVRSWFSDIGLDSERIAFETASRNTYENAVLSHRKLRPEASQVWLLVTSAQHMPRAVGVFRKLGWPIVPYPVDFRTAGPDNLVGYPDLAVGLDGLATVLKEWVGLLAYYLMDRTDELWPATAGS